MNIMYKVKREEMDDSFATQAQLESTVTSMSEIILEHKSRLVEFKEALECCICFERSVCSPPLLACSIGFPPCVREGVLCPCCSVCLDVNKA